MIALQTLDEKLAWLDYARFKSAAKWTLIPIPRNFPRLAIGTVELQGDEENSWIATHATDAFNPPHCLTVFVFAKASYPRFKAEEAAIESEVETIVERFAAEMRRPGSPVDLRPLQWAIDAAKAFGGRLSLKKYEREKLLAKGKTTEMKIAEKQKPPGKPRRHRNEVPAAGICQGGGEKSFDRSSGNGRVKSSNPPKNADLRGNSPGLLQRT